ncbi:SdpI family protein [Flavobacterium dauae]|uniref:SdpI family protein n=1 Tax=Flavobacterium dauae TaxID=1563479 RepID=UPI00101B4235|nr:SdpI family protein [Flavobacterium dauae]WLD24789.1 SdpI family protein [Flavobacterium dauae]
MDKILEITNPMLLHVGVIFYIVGIIMNIFPPKKINSLYGYRTASSMENQTKWDFAQKYSAKIMSVIGLLLVVLSFYRPYLNLSNDQHAILGLAVLIASAISLIVIVEKRLKQILSV